MGSSKILVVGSLAGGSLSAAFAKIGAIHSKHGPFAMVLCVGDLWPAGVSAEDEELQALLSGKVKVPVSTYFIAGQHALPEPVKAAATRNGGEVCENLYFLGDEGLYTTLDGVKIAYLSGVFDRTTAASASGDGGPTRTSSARLTSAAVTALCANASPPDSAPSSVDVLVTTEWALGVTRGSAAWEKAAGAARRGAGWVGVPPVAEAVARLRPRYHFAAVTRADGGGGGGGGEAMFFEREPFTHVDQAGVGAPGVSRFIGLGAFNGAKKDRWFYAFNLVPAAVADKASLMQLPPNATTSPLTAPQGTKRGADESNDGNFFWQTVTNPRAKRQKGANPPPAHYTCRICQQPGHWIQECPQKTGGGARPDAAAGQQQTQQQHRSNATPPEGYVCRACNVPGHYIRECPSAAANRGGGSGAAPGRRFADREARGCWFCLSTPTLEKHLLISIGEEAYLALAKGGISEWGGHVILVPLAHVASRRQLDAATLAEMAATAGRVGKAFGEKGCVPVAFEVCAGGEGEDGGAAGVMHGHVQIVPIPADLAGDPLYNAVRALAEEEGQTMHELDAAATGAATLDDPLLGLPSDPAVPYVRMELPTADGGVRVVVVTPQAADGNAGLGWRTVEHAVCEESAVQPARLP
ncbi:CwfJ C-terminus 1-domain-containing protein-like protein [Zopfochytrium polystomum]|nr:CwfJ C-terminus 1-domain-containing protein-like protein [Zopfochytrium polystomum]